MRSKPVHIVKLWLEVKITGSLTYTAFNNEKVLVDMFMRYNTVIPSNAGVKHLFSFRKNINRAERSSLSDGSFNIFRFIKGNTNVDLI